LYRKRRVKYTYFSNIKKNEFMKSSLDESFSNIFNGDAGKTIEKLILKYLERNENYGIGTLKITGMNCAHYVNKIEETLLSLQDVENARVNLKKGIARVKFDETVRASR
tara:strand:+ start:462 stop:788 length:327 start_codon:yes stop_codon:yes gene_type:complete